MHAGNRKDMFLYGDHAEDEWIYNELRVVKKRNTYWMQTAVNSGLDTLAPNCPTLTLSAQKQLQNEEDISGMS